MNKELLNFRQIHLDFHTSPDIPGIGEHFNAEEFAGTLVDAHVNSITCFAKCHHGMMYYDSKVFPERIHPHLENKNLLKEMIEACHKRGIKVPIYITVQWDKYTACEHPEWLTLSAEGKLSGHRPYDGSFYDSLCLNSPYRDLLKKTTLEVLETLPTDGVFFDIVFLGDCSCKYCLQDMKEQGIDVLDVQSRLKFNQDMIDDFKEDMTKFIRKVNKDCTIFYNTSHISPAQRPILDAYTHFELESLPSGSWGYMHFPVTMRYARTLGKECMGMTGKFHTEWGDFHSFKNEAALEFECFSMLALGAKCSIGDQLEPNGRLSQPVYELIGKVYKQVEEKEPWCIGVKPLVDIGVFTPDEFNFGNSLALHKNTIGVARMLQEAGHQFDFIDTMTDFTQYKVLVLPDTIPVDEVFNSKLESYIQKGGKVIATFESGLSSDKKEFNFTGLGLNLNENPTTDVYGNLVRGVFNVHNSYTDYIIPQDELGKSLPQVEHCLYTRGVEVTPKEGTKVLAPVICSYFDRDYRHFCSHRQTPSSGKEGHPAVTRHGDATYFAHPIFTTYATRGAKWCKTLFLNALDMLLQTPLLVHNGPTTLVATLGEQVESGRLVTHLLHYIPERRADIDVIEDIIPVYNIEVSIQADKPIGQVLLVPQMRPIEFTVANNQVTFIVPEVKGHQMISIE